MTRIILSGCSGTMGRVVTDCVAKNEDCRIVAGIDARAGREFPYPVFQSPEETDAEADVLIDFSSPSLLTPLLDFGKKHKLPLVLCTTGYNKEQDDEIRKASEFIPIFHSGNMSFGINLLIELAKRAARALGGYDIEIIEEHHNQKMDAPSGTALMIADSITSALNKKTNYVYDRHSQRKKREPNEIGIHSIRGGTIVGEHKVIFAGPHEVITLSHSAQSKDIFALGALHAASFLAYKANGLYTMSNLLN